MQKESESDVTHSISSCDISNNSATQPLLSQQKTSPFYKSKNKDTTSKIEGTQSPQPSSNLLFRTYGRPWSPKDGNILLARSLATTTYYWTQNAQVVSWHQLYRLYKSYLAAAASGSTEPENQLCKHLRWGGVTVGNSHCRRLNGHQHATARNTA